MKIDDQIKEIINDNYLSHGESCGANYFGVKEWTCRCGNDRNLKEDIESIHKLFVSIIGECLPKEESDYAMGSHGRAFVEGWNAFRDEFIDRLREKGLEVGK